MGRALQSSVPGAITKRIAPIISRAQSQIISGLKQNGNTQHKGFSLVDIMQPCVIFNDKDVRQQYRDKVYKLEDTDYKPTDKLEAYKKAGEIEKLPIGVLYQEDRPTYESQLPQIKKEPLVKHPVEKVDLTPFLKEFK